jgi:uncharacterized membrane protein YkvA (DUF1232 family)
MPLGPGLYVTYLKGWAQRLKRDVHALHLAAYDPRVPWHAKVAAMATAAYAFSPVDLIPDFVPILGYLDDLVIVPLGIFIAVKLVPIDLMEEFRRAAVNGRQDRRAIGKIGAAIIILLWIVGVTLAVLWIGARSDAYRPAPKPPEPRNV